MNQKGRILSVLFLYQNRYVILENIPLCAIRLDSFLDVINFYLKSLILKSLFENKSYVFTDNNNMLIKKSIYCVKVFIFKN